MVFAQPIAKVCQRMANMMIPLLWISYNQILNLRCLCMYIYVATTVLIDLHCTSFISEHNITANIYVCSYLANK